MAMLSFCIDPPVLCTSVDTDTWSKLVASGASPSVQPRSLSTRSPSMSSKSGMVASTSGSLASAQRGTYWLTIKDDDDSCQHLFGYAGT